MNFNFFKKGLLGAIVLSSAVFLSSCLDGGTNTFPTRVQVGLKINNVIDTLIAGQDNLIISEVRIIQGESFFGWTDSTGAQRDRVYFLNPDAQSPRQITFDISQFANLDEAPALVLGQGSFPGGDYDSLSVDIVKAPESAPRIDPEFIENGKRYTIIVDGLFNGEEFTFKSEREMNMFFRFQPKIDVPESNEQFAFIIETNIRRWFAGDPAGGFYAPSDENSKEINDNIENSFTIDVSSTTGLTGF